jgi:VanZ family protein
MGRIIVRGAFFGLTALVIWLSVKVPGEGPGIPIWDKLQHFLAYAVLGVTGALGFPGKKPAFVLALGLVLLGAALEVAQSYVPARDMSLGDGIADLLGVIFGVGLGYLVTRGRLVGGSR